MKLLCGHKLAGSSKKDDGQDFFTFKKTENAIIAAVADGVGSEKHSAFGSKVVCTTAVDFCVENLKPNMDDNAILSIIYNSFDHAWQCIEKQAKEENLDVYQCNTTLALAVYMDGNVFYGNIGDSGIFAFLEDGKIEPITNQHNDKEGRVYTLSFGPKMWEFDKVSKKAVSLLLCTDGVWGMFFPERLSDEEEKHSVSLLAWYIDPEAIKAHNNGDGLQKWLESDMADTNSKNPAMVNYDDITMVIVHDGNVNYKRQPEPYYAPPTEEELEKAKKAEHERLYGHLNKSETNSKGNANVGTQEGTNDENKSGKAD